MKQAIRTITVIGLSVLLFIACNSIQEQAPSQVKAPTAGAVSTKAPKGHEDNWIQTIPGKSYNVLLRLYGPLEPWFDKTWKPGDLELVE